MPLKLCMVIALSCATKIAWTRMGLRAGYEMNSSLGLQVWWGGDAAQANFFNPRPYKSALDKIRRPYVLTQDSDDSQKIMIISQGRVWMWWSRSISTIYGYGSVLTFVIASPALVFYNKMSYIGVFDVLEMFLIVPLSGLLYAHCFMRGWPIFIRWVLVDKTIYLSVIFFTMLPTLLALYGISRTTFFRIGVIVGMIAGFSCSACANAHQAQETSVELPMEEYTRSPTHFKAMCRTSWTIKYQILFAIPAVLTLRQIRKHRSLVSACCSPLAGLFGAGFAPHGRLDQSLFTIGGSCLFASHCFDSRRLGVIVEEIVCGESLNEGDEWDFITLVRWGMSVSRNLSKYFLDRWTLTDVGTEIAESQARTVGQIRRCLGGDDGRRPHGLGIKNYFLPHHPERHPDVHRGTLRIYASDGVGGVLLETLRDRDMSSDFAALDENLHEAGHWLHSTNYAVFESVATWAESFNLVTQICARVALSRVYTVYAGDGVVGAFMESVIDRHVPL